MGNMFKGEPWERVAERRARAKCREIGQPEALWELVLFEVNREMMKELRSTNAGG